MHHGEKWKQNAAVGYIENAKMLRLKPTYTHIPTSWHAVLESNV